MDLGASSGRVMSAELGPGGLTLTEVHRFANRPLRLRGTLHWNLPALYQEVLDGLHELTGTGLRGVGIDSWAVDYALLDGDGGLLGLPVHYRDDRTEGRLEELLARIPPDTLYARTGLQHLRINTLVQLLAEGPRLHRAAHLLLVPDLLTYWLTGELGAERTNASTTQLLDVTTGEWATDLLSAVDIPAGILPPLREPGTVAGTTDVLPDPLRVTRVASHDTASAVAAVPAETEHFAYISCGTWSLVGLELDAPVLTEASRAANFTNEQGLDGTTRYLRNVVGLWLLQECQRTWAADFPALLSAAADLPSPKVPLDVNDPVFLPPGDMPTRVQRWYAARDLPVPRTPPGLTRAILVGLAHAHHEAITEAIRLTGRSVEVVHLVGGGAANTLLCQLTADACGLPVVAGPVEATALGNALVQLRADRDLPLPALRELIRRSTDLVRYDPR